MDYSYDFELGLAISEHDLLRNFRVGLYSNMPFTKILKTTSTYFQKMLLLLHIAWIK